MPNSTPLVSVIMPAYNSENFIKEAIFSVIAQTVQEWELIVIDDGSSDGTYAMVEQIQQQEPRVCLLRNEANMGVARTRNRGIALAQGQYIAFLDSDDIWHPKKLELQLQKMEATGADMSYCSYHIIGVTGQKARADYIVLETARFSDILKENYIQCSAMLIRADVVKNIMFRTDFYHEDYALGLDILKAGKTAAGCSEILLSWRYIENSRSFNKKKSAKNRWKIYREYLCMPLYKAGYYFLHYCLAGFRKYLRRP